MSKIKTAVRLLKEERGEFMASILTNFFKWLPNTIYLKLLYRFKMGYRLDLKNPKTFNEKIQWLKLYNRRPEYTTMVDKYAVKQYVAERIGEEHIIPTLGVWEKTEEIDWDSLPNQFVLKTTHGGGGGGVVICKDKASFDRNTAIKKLNKSLDSDIYSRLREWPYKNVIHRIIAEEYLEVESDEEELMDYKVMCFNGIPRLIQVHRGRFETHTQDFYDVNWNHLPYTQGLPMSQKQMLPPLVLPKMIELSAMLSKDIPFLRVDWYIVSNQLYFGELTFYDASGYDNFDQEEINEEIGEWIELPQKGNLQHLKTYNNGKSK